MAWVRLDDHFPEHSKLVSLGRMHPLAVYLQVCALCYCNRHLTDGKFPRNLPVHWWPWQGQIDFHNWESDDQPEPITGLEIAQALIEGGIWHDCGGGLYEIHDYLHYQPSRKDAEALRNERVSSGRKGGKQTAKQNRSKRLARTLAKSHPNPGPVPSTDPSDQTGARRAPTSDVQRFIAWWQWGYQEFRGSPYAVAWKREAPMVAELLKTFSLPRLKQMAMFLWHDEKDQWIASTPRGIGILRHCATTLAQWVTEAERKGRLNDAPEPEASDAA